MIKTNLLDKYPVYSFSVAKNETTFQSVDEIITFFKAKIEAHPFAIYIAVFDHAAHTRSIEEHLIDPNLQEGKNLIFCFGKQLPNCKMLAVRPRSIGVSEFAESFSIDFMEVPNEQLQVTVEGWVREIKNK